MIWGIKIVVLSPQNLDDPCKYIKQILALYYLVIQTSTKYLVQICFVFIRFLAWLLHFFSVRLFFPVEIFFASEFLIWDMNFTPLLNFPWLWDCLLWISCTKGQLISKANCQAVNSSKKRTNEFIFTMYATCFRSFFWRILGQKKMFRDYLTFSK